ncbi:MAG TPA: hypothetical protein VND90_00650 [Terracidiphilus sp.]|nr:hypothetical protein [Terracidiphilus sp.]
MRGWRLAAAMAGCVLCAMATTAIVAAQRTHHDPLTGPEIEKIREAGIDPSLRIKLYADYVKEHVETVVALSKRIPSVARDKKMDQALQDLSSLIDELGSNLDEYGGRKADLRPALKGLAKDSPLWLAELKAIQPATSYRLSLEDATDAEKDLVDQSAEMLKDQTAYFKLHKDQRGQERYEPQD